MTRPALAPVASVDDLFRLDPLARFEALIAGPNFDDYLRAEPITFPPDHPIFGTSCGVAGCAGHSTQAEWWCTRHGQARRDALRQGIGEAEWLTSATPYPPRQRPSDGRRPACRFCPERDAAARDLCRQHEMRLYHARRKPGFDEEQWAAQQVAFPGAGDCRVAECPRRAEREPGLCPNHRDAWVAAGRLEGPELESWLATRSAYPVAGLLPLAGLPALVATEIRYGLWTHTRSGAPARWHPMWLRTLVKSCERTGVGSLTELNPSDRGWTPQPEAVNRVLREMLKDIMPVHRTRADTRDLGYLDTNYWGFRYPNRRSPFDLRSIPQRWLRDITWDFLAAQLDAPGHPRTQGPFEQVRRSVVCLGAYLRDCVPGGGADPVSLTESTAREFVADLRRCVSEGRPLRGLFNVRGEPSVATEVTYPLTLNAVRRVLRWALESGAAAAAGLRREFVVAVPPGGGTTFRNPRPFSDEVLRALSDPTNIAVLHAMDGSDLGLADIWSIQVRCGRRIGEVVKLRLDCVGEHLGRTWLWVDMTKVGKLDYAIQVPGDVYDLVRARQAKTVERFRRRHGAEPTASQRRAIALFPSPVTNPSFERSISASKFTVSFKAWIESEQVRLPGHTTHQARHTLATRLVNAGASMAHVKRVLGHVSERMGDSYVLIAGSQVEPFLQQVWVTGPGNPEPGRIVLTPSDAERSAAEALMVDLAAVPIEHGLCTYKPVVGGFDCPFGRRCDACEHFVITGADYAYWKRQEERWATLAEGAPAPAARDYIYGAFERSSQALAGLEKALVALGLLDDAKALDLRSPHQDFFQPVWAKGWRAGDLVELGGGTKAAGASPDEEAREAS